VHVVVFVSLAAMGAGLGVAAETVAHQGDVRIAALAVALPAAGFLAGIVVVMTITGTSALDRRVTPKLGGAASMVLVALVAPVVVTVITCAAMLAFLAAWMVLDGAHRHPSQPDARNA
jgi:hypothetical protein